MVISILLVGLVGVGIVYSVALASRGLGAGVVTAFVLAALAVGVLTSGDVFSFQFVVLTPLVAWMALGAAGLGEVVATVVFEALV